jgi:Helix-turn-helix domain
MKAVWDRGPAELNEWVVLLTLARFAGDDGQKCWPKITTIAAKARVGERSVKRATKTLEAGGWISILCKNQDPSWVSADEKDTIDSRGNSYHISLGRLGEAISSDSQSPELPNSSDSQSLPSEPEPQTEVTHSPNSSAKSARPYIEPVLNHYVADPDGSSTLPAASASGEFVLTPESPSPPGKPPPRKAVFSDAELIPIYNAYPKRESRREALAAMRKALERIITEKSFERGQALGWLMRQVEHYAANGAKKKEYQYIPEPAKWLNKDKFYDEDGPPNAGGGKNGKPNRSEAITEDNHAALEATLANFQRNSGGTSQVGDHARRAVGTGAHGNDVRGTLRLTSG